MSRRKYKNAAEKQRAFRESQKAIRARAIRLWVLPPADRAHLLRDVPWLRALSRERDELLSRLSEAERLATIGRNAEAEINRLLDRVAKFEKMEKRREQNRNRKRQRREGGVIVDSDPGPIRKHYQQPSAFAPIAPTSPNSGQNWTRTGQEQDTIRPKVGQNRNTINPKIAQNSVAPPAPVQPRTAFSRPAGPSSGPSARPAVPAAPVEQPWWVAAGIKTASPIPRSAPPPSEEERAASEKLLDRIKRNGYRVNASDGTVLFDGRWIPAEEWMKRNGNVLD